MAYILGVRVDSVELLQAKKRVEEFLVDSGQHLITTPNPEMLVAAQEDGKFKAILNSASLALPDGTGLVLAARILGQRLPTRIHGTDFVWEIAEIAAKPGARIYLLGGRGEVAARAAEKLKMKNKNLQIVGATEGPINALQLSTYNLQPIRDAQPDILLVALGHGKQEKWIAAHLRELPSVKIAMGVGGAFDFIAGNVARAPRFMRTLGLEWLWRLILQPRRIVRIYHATVIFPLLVLRERLFNLN